MRLLFVLTAFLLGLHSSLPALATQPHTPAYIALYETADTRYCTTADGQFTDLTGRLAVLLEDAPKHGLNPDDYNIHKLRSLLSVSKPATQPAWQEAELHCMFSLWAYASDLAGRPLKPESLRIILTSKNPIATIRALAPQTELYEKLQHKLADLNTQEKAATPPTVFNFGKKPFTAGMTHKDIPLLRKKLQEYGANITLNTDSYDDELEVAVKKFQQANGLEADGKLGGMTTKILNRTPDDLRVQVVASLAQLRKLRPQDRPARRVEAVIPRFNVVAYENNAPVLTMKSIVGRTERQTNDFTANITGLRLNPTWTVPDTIKHEDMLAKLRHNQDKFNQLGVEIYAANGLKIDPKLIDWENVSRKEMARLRLWRPAGHDNPLGQYRVLMPNKYDIYLHDTNEKNKFSQANRALSSGCIRVENPKALAEYLMIGQKDWSAERIQSVLKRGKTYDILLDTPLPVYIDYVTSWLDDNGQLVMGLDVYEKDRVKTTAMKTDASKRLATATALLNGFAARLAQNTPLTTGSEK